jgi:hypothetical protein
MGRNTYLNTGFTSYTPFKSRDKFYTMHDFFVPSPYLAYDFSARCEEPFDADPRMTIRCGERPALGW